MNEARRLEYINSTRDKIAKYGHVVQAVSTEPYAYAYTIGLTPTLGFELITMGLPIPTAQHLLNEVAALVMDTPCQSGTDVRLPSYTMPMQLRDLDPEQGKRIHLISIARAVGLYPRTLRQVLWPDPNGHFPSDAKYDFHCQQDLDDLAQQMI